MTPLETAIREKLGELGQQSIRIDAQIDVLLTILGEPVEIAQPHAVLVPPSSRKPARATESPVEDLDDTDDYPPAGDGDEAVERRAKSIEKKRAKTAKVIEPGSEMGKIVELVKHRAAEEKTTGASDVVAELKLNAQAGAVRLRHLADNVLSGVKMLAKGVYTYEQIASDLPVEKPANPLAKPGRGKRTSSECADCGADVSLNATRCPKCGGSKLSLE